MTPLTTPIFDFHLSLRLRLRLRLRFRRWWKPAFFKGSHMSVNGFPLYLIYARRKAVTLFKSYSLARDNIRPPKQHCAASLPSVRKAYYILRNETKYIEKEEKNAYYPKHILRCFDTVFRRRYRRVSITLKVILSLSDSHQWLTMNCAVFT